MTIKEVKNKYSNYAKDYHWGGETKFVVMDSWEHDDKFVIIVAYESRDFKDVVQVVRVSDGAFLLGLDRCRPCYNLQDDAIDVAWEMLWGDTTFEKYYDKDGKRLA